MPDGEARRWIVLVDDQIESRIDGQNELTALTWAWTIYPEARKIQLLPWDYANPWKRMEAERFPVIGRTLLEALGLVYQPPRPVAESRFVNVPGLAKALRESPGTNLEASGIRILPPESPPPPEEPPPPREKKTSPLKRYAHRLQGHFARTTAAGGAR